MKQKQLIKDLGHTAEFTPAEVPKVIPMKIAGYMDSPRFASFIHIKNLIETYGLDVVKEAMEVARQDYE